MTELIHEMKYPSNTQLSEWSPAILPRQAPGLSFTSWALPENTPTPLILGGATTPTALTNFITRPPQRRQAAHKRRGPAQPARIYGKESPATPGPRRLAPAATRRPHDQFSLLNNTTMEVK